MANEQSKRMNPMIIVDPETGKEYTLEFNRKSVMKCESAGLDIGAVNSKSMTMLPMLFWGAFQMHHPYMKQEATDKILFEGLKGLHGDELEYLAGLYAEPYKSLLADTEDGESENPLRTMVVKI